MAQHVLCHLHWHKWTPDTNPDGDAYDRCSRCDVDRYIDVSSPAGGPGETGYMEAQALREVRDRWRRRCR